MQKTFKFYSDYFSFKEHTSKNEITIRLEPESKYTGSYEIIEIFDEDNKILRKISDFPEKEQLRILDKANLLADSNNYEAWLDTKET